MTKSKAYSFNNIFVFLIFLSLFGCGNTLSKSDQEIEILTGNSATVRVNEFTLSKLVNKSDFANLPREFTSYANPTSHFDFYFAQSPMQTSGGYIFKVIRQSEKLTICLKRPDPLSAVTTSLTNPIALIKVKKNIAVEMNLDYCAK